MVDNAVYADFSSIEIPLSDYVLCNCYQYIKSVFGDSLPSTKHILNNLQDSGSIAVFYYPESDLFHFAQVIETSVNTITVHETNYFSCKESTRVVNINDKTLIGFYGL